ncbi:MAG: hypothetical protein ACI4CT_05350 [Lachnospiraceae bacterium]
MEFEKDVPRWDNPGAEPPEELLENGFVAGYKPPAGYFNWFFNKISAAVKEIREKMFSGNYNDLNNKPTSMKNPYALTVNGKSYTGESTVNAGTQGIAYGGTGATTAEQARINLGTVSQDDFNEGIEKVSELALSGERITIDVDATAGDYVLFAKDALNGLGNGGMSIFLVRVSYAVSGKTAWIPLMYDGNNLQYFSKENVNENTSNADIQFGVASRLVGGTKGYNLYLYAKYEHGYSGSDGTAEGYAITKLEIIHYMNNGLQLFDTAIGLQADDGKDIDGYTYDEFYFYEAIKSNKTYVQELAPSYPQENDLWIW